MCLHQRLFPDSGYTVLRRVEAKVELDRVLRALQEFPQLDRAAHLNLAQIRNQGVSEK